MRLATLAVVLVAAGPTLAQEPVVLAPGHPDLAVEAVVPASRVVAVRNGEQVMGTVREDVRLDGGTLTVVTSTAVSMAGPPARMVLPEIRDAQESDYEFIRRVARRLNETLGGDDDADADE